MQPDLLLTWTGEAGYLHTQHGFPSQNCAILWFEAVCKGLPKGGTAALFDGGRLVAAGRKNLAGVCRWRVRG